MFIARRMSFKGTTSFDIMRELLAFGFILFFGFSMGLSMDHHTEMCFPQINRQDIFDLAVTSGVKVLIRQVELYNEDLPISSNMMVEITSMFSKFILSGKSIKFILRLLYVACKLNKPTPGELQKEQAHKVETAFLCLLEMGAEKCYSYKDKEEGDFSIEIP
ncbi:uncharacterized protein LOC108026590 [Drosophila biarmipes]|uniref:uncharacterized protein LOC108026590 n=1 Tax=Drosophila biarmipes TaxID=125945 RepID=UPI0007E6CACF|nr:uncharacterized protein LOC108026590 [Drosophila biarmipes]